MTGSARSIFGLTGVAASVAVTGAIIHLIELRRLLLPEEGLDGCFPDYSVTDRDLRVAFALTCGFLALCSRWALAAALTLPIALLVYYWLIDPRVGFQTEPLTHVIAAITIVSAFVLLKVSASGRNVATLALIYVVVEYALWCLRSYARRGNAFPEDSFRIQASFAYLIGADWWHIARLALCVLLLALHSKELFASRSAGDLRTGNQ